MLEIGPRGSQSLRHVGFHDEIRTSLDSFAGPSEASTACSGCSVLNDTVADIVHGAGHLRFADGAIFATAANFKRVMLVVESPTLAPLFVRPKVSFGILMGLIQYRMILIFDRLDRMRHFKKDTSVGDLICTV